MRVVVIRGQGNTWLEIEYSGIQILQKKGRETEERRICFEELAEIRRCYRSSQCAPCLHFRFFPSDEKHGESVIAFGSNREVDEAGWLVRQYWEWFQQACASRKVCGTADGP